MFNYLLSPERRKYQLQSLILYQLRLAAGDQTLEERIKLFGVSQLIKAHEYPCFDYPICHLHGFHLWLLFTDGQSSPSFQTDFHAAMLSTIDRLRENVRLGLTVPKLIMTVVIQQCENLLQLHPRNGAIRHSLDCFLVYSKTIYIYLCRSSIALQALNDDFYNFKIFKETTLPLNAQQVHSIGLYEIGTTVARMAQPPVASEASHQNPTTVVTNRKIALKLVKDSFLPPFMYIFSPYQESVLMVNVDKYHHRHLDCLTAHEVYPGHHLEVSNNFKNWFGSDVWWLSNFNSYIEGWGFYCEQTEQQSSSEVHQLELLRDVRLVVDTGVHSHHCGKWTYADAFMFMKSGIFRGKRVVKGFHGLFFWDDAAIHAEILSIISKPAYALTYKIGKMFFQYHRDKQLLLGKSTQTINDTFLSRRVPLHLMGELFTQEKSVPNPGAADIEAILTQDLNSIELTALTSYTSCCL